MKTPILLITLLLLNCLKASRSPFDINSPSGALGSGIVFSFDSNSTKQTDSSSTYSIGGSITGFTSGTLVLQLNGGSDVSLTPSNSYQIGTVGLGTTYTVTIKTNPSGFTCTIANGTGTATANVTNADITCTSSSVTTNYTIGGNITGFTSGTLVLQLNGGSDMSLSPTSSYQVGSVSSGASYVVTIKTNPTGLTCTIVNGTGTATANVTNADITCTATTVASYTIGGSVTGLTSGVLVLRNNGGNDLSVNVGSSSFQFTSSVTSGSTYAVTIQGQPSSLTCSVANGSGTATANVTNVSITCAVITYTVGGSVTGLSSGALVVQNNGGNDLNISAGASSFQFTTAIASGSSYAVTILTPASGLTCSVGNGSGTISANVTNVTITCSATTYTIGGTITGLSTGTLVVQNNGTNNLSINSGVTTFQFTTPIAQNSTYSVTVNTNPSGFNCQIANSSGTVTNSNITNISITCNSLSISPLYKASIASTLSTWNYYVKNDGSNFYSALGNNCLDTVTGGYSTCLHTGEIQKFEVPNKTSCTGLKAEDNAVSGGAFNWICTVISGKATFFSTSLNRNNSTLGRNVYLSDLIDWTLATPDWKSIKLTIKENGTTIFETIPAKWWDNSFTKLDPTQATLTSLTTTYTIYVATDSAFATRYFEVGANTNSIGFVVKPGIKLSLNACDNGNDKILFLKSGSKFNWVEGQFDAYNQRGAVSLINSKFNVLKNVSIIRTGVNRGATCTGGTLTDLRLETTSNNNFVENVIVAASVAGGEGNINVIASINNLFKDVSIYNGSGRGINLDWSSSSIISPYNTVISLIAANMTGTGISVEVESNFLFNLTSSNNSGGEGVNIANSANSNLISNLLTVNNSGPGILTGTSNDNTFQNTINYSSGNPQIQLGGANNRFTGVLKVKTATSSCTVVGGAGLDTNCAGGITSDFNSGSNLPETIASLGSTVQGKVTTTDGEFLSGSLAFSSITNWTSFSNPFRTIGKDGTDLDDMNIQNRCSSGTCRLWDWSLKLGDTIARNTNICPLGSHFITHKFNVAGASAAVCNSTLIGSTYDSGTLCKLTFLRNAVELIGDGVGNDNGICESNEDCLYTPNVGTYQGHGAIVPASQVTSTTNTCADITTGGTIQNVKLYKYEANGY